MIEKALSAAFKVVTEEAATNPGFARRLEDALAKFAEDLVETRRAEHRVSDFHPLIEFKTSSPEAFRARLLKFDAKELRVIVDKHNLDPAGLLKAKAAKSALADHIAAAAQKRAERDARLFEY